MEEGRWEDGARGGVVGPEVRILSPLSPSLMKTLTSIS